MPFHQSSFLPPPSPHTESAFQRLLALYEEQMNISVFHHCQQFHGLMVPCFSTDLTSGHSYMLQRNEVTALGFRMSWDKT